jgi:spermidine/putrescine ABC transporter ATP-binding subunit
MSSDLSCQRLQKTVDTPKGKGAIELRALVKRYDGERVVDSVSVTIAPGEFFSLLGPSGSGKTTTLMMIAGFAKIDDGSILVDGVDISDIPPQKRGFGMVFQNYALFPHLNVFGNIAFPLRARRLSSGYIREQVNWALKLVRLEKLANRQPQQLSGGQQQRVAIARAIVFSPRLVLMDEPLGALDKNLRYQMQVEIKDIQQRLGMTVVYVTHDQEEAMNLSDRIAIMNNGRAEQIGVSAEVYETPASIFTARFLGEANIIDGTIVDVQNGITVLRATGGLQLSAKNSAEVMCGESAALFIRPEKVIINPKGSHSQAKDANHITGSLQRVSFLGNIHRYVVEVAGGSEMTIDVQNSNGGIASRLGDTVTISFSALDCVILKS